MPTYIGHSFPGFISYDMYDMYMYPYLAERKRAPVPPPKKKRILNYDPIGLLIFVCLPSQIPLDIQLFFFPFSLPSHSLQLQWPTPTRITRILFLTATLHTHRKLQRKRGDHWVKIPGYWLNNPPFLGGGGGFPCSLHPSFGCRTYPPALSFSWTYSEPQFGWQPLLGLWWCNVRLFNFCSN